MDNRSDVVTRMTMIVSVNHRETVKACYVISHINSSLSRIERKSKGARMMNINMTSLQHDFITTCLPMSVSYTDLNKSFGPRSFLYVCQSVCLSLRLSLVMYIYMSAAPSASMSVSRYVYLYLYICI